MDWVLRILFISLNFDVAASWCGAESCYGTIFTVVGIIIGVLIVLIIVASICFGVCGMIGYACGCLKATEAPPRIRPQQRSAAVAGSSEGTSLHYPPPPYTDIDRNYGAAYPLPPSPLPPSYSSLDHGHFPPTYSSLNTGSNRTGLMTGSKPLCRILSK